MVFENLLTFFYYRPTYFYHMTLRNYLCILSSFRDLKAKHCFVFTLRLRIIHTFLDVNETGKC